MKISEKTPTELRDMALRALKQSYEARGLTSVNVGKDSDNFVRFDALAEVLYLSLANSESTADDIFASTASDDATIKIAESLGIDKRPATEASGNVIISLTISGTVPISAGDTLASDTGVVYEVVTGGVYSDLDYVPIKAVEPGIGGNIPLDTPLQWVSSISGLYLYAYVDQLGITGGREEDDIETLKKRIEERRSLATVAGSPQHLIGVAEDVSAAVQKAYAYPALFGPASGCIVLQGYYDENTGYSKVVSDYVVQAVDDAISAIIPAEMKVSVFSIAEEETDIVFGFDLPEPKPQGQGGGWVQASAVRFPALDDEGVCTIRAFHNASTFNVNSATEPVVGSRIAIWENQEKRFIKATVLAKLNTWIGPGSLRVYQILIDVALPNLTVGMYVSPDCELIESYGDYIVNVFGSMGPGEATDDAGRLPRAYRVPPSTHSYYSNLGSRMFRNILNEFLEVQDITITSSTRTPTIPTIGDPPNGLVPGHIGIYPVV